MLLLLKYVWLIFVLGTCARAAIWWRRGRQYRERDPFLTEGYRSLVRGLVLWGNIPWLFMGAGILLGGVPTVLHFLNPRSPEPYVRAFFLSLLGLGLLGTHWMFVRGGAEQLARHPGLFPAPITSPGVYKALWIMTLAAGVGGVTAMFVAHFQPPGF